jgi:tRNA:m4X modification enzyme
LPEGAAADAADDADEGDEDGSVSHKQPAAHIRVFDIPDVTVNDLGRRLLAASSALNLLEDFRSHAPCESLMTEAHDSGSQRPRLRHLRQQLSIAGHLQLSGGLTPRHVIVEFGAGKAGLSRTLCRGHPNNTYVLVDRQSFKSKKDCRLRDEKEGAGAECSYVRVRCDVQDLDLSAVDVCQRVPVSIVGKHLCGGCTDLSMRANCHWKKGCRSRPGVCPQCSVLGTDAAPPSRQRSESACADSHPATDALAAANDVFVVSTCCHHRMSWDVFAGQQHWLHLGFSRADFETARQLSAWHNLWGAACVAPGFTSDRGSSASETGGGRSGRSFEWMRSVGRAAKDVFDACR